MKHLNNMSSNIVQIRVTETSNNSKFRFTISKRKYQIKGEEYLSNFYILLT